MLHCTLGETIGADPQPAGTVLRIDVPTCCRAGVAGADALDITQTMPSRSLLRIEARAIRRSPIGSQASRCGDNQDKSGSRRRSLALGESTMCARIRGAVTLGVIASLGLVFSSGEAVGADAASAARD